MSAPSTPPSPGVVFVGSSRYDVPLPAALRKKFDRLHERLGPLVVIASSSYTQAQTFEVNGARFILHARYARWRRLAGRFVWSVLQLRRLIASGEAGVVLAQSPYEGVAALLACHLTPGGRRVGLVVEAHSDFEASAGVRFGRLVGALEQAVQPLFQVVLRRADAIRVISTATDAMVARVAPAVPRVLFPAWTDMDAFVEARATRDEAHVLYAGVLTPLKNVHTLIAAFARAAASVPAARLSLVGATEDPAYASELKAQVARLGIDGRVVFVPEVTQAELATRMAGAAVFVLPSKSEGLGRVVFEAMATGTPVIGANVGGIPSMVTPGETGWLVEPSDEHALTAALVEALADPAQTRVRGERARVFATRFFSTEAYLDGMTRLVETARTRAAQRVSR